MSGSTEVKPKRRGRPETGWVFAGQKWPPDELARVDTWAAENDPPISRSEAIRRLVETGLKG